MRNLKTLVPFLKEHIVVLCVGFVFMLLHNYGFMQTPIYMKKALDEITQANRFEVILPHLLLILAYTVVTVGSMFLMRKLIISASRRIEHALRKQIYHKLLALDMAFYQKNETGDLVSRCTNDLNEVRQLLGPGIMYVPNSLSRFALFLPILFGLSARLMTIVLALMAFLIVIIMVVLPRFRPMFRHIQEATGNINSRVWQTVSGITTLKLYTLEQIEIDRFKDLNNDYIKRHMRVVKIRGFLWPFFMFIFALTELVILYVGGQQVINGELTIGELLQFNIMISHLTFPILSLGWVMSLIQQGISAMGRINYVLDYPVETRDDWNILETDELVFTAKQLNYHYPEHRLSTSKNIPANAQALSEHTSGDTPAREKVLDDVTLTIEPGQVIGITGTIGSGKSTLVNLMTGLFRPERGMLFVNDIDICDIQPESLFDKVSVVPQEPFLFSRSLAENISLGSNGNLDLDAVKEAVRKAGLERDIETFPEHYDQMVGERGITLSGGQKQRTAIARALRKQSPVLVFDDALSSVDAQTESEILDTLQALDKFKTLIVISHRISALKNASRIYVMDEGKIVEHGTHSELIQHGHLYARLAKMQQMEMAME